MQRSTLPWLEHGAAAVRYDGGQINLIVKENLNFEINQTAYRTRVRCLRDKDTGLLYRSAEFNVINHKLWNTQEYREIFDVEASWYNSNWKHTFLSSLTSHVVPVLMCVVQDIFGA